LGNYPFVHSCDGKGTKKWKEITNNSGDFLPIGKKELILPLKPK
jgi:hypothetical protein